jgi:hypothetical protein
MFITCMYMTYYHFVNIHDIVQFIHTYRDGNSTVPGALKSSPTNSSPVAVENMRMLCLMETSSMALPQWFCLRN